MEFNYLFCNSINFDHLISREKLKIVYIYKIKQKMIFLIIGAFGNVKYAWLKKKTSEKFAIKAMKKVDII